MVSFECWIIHLQNVGQHKCATSASGRCCEVVIRFLPSPSRLTVLYVRLRPSSKCFRPGSSSTRLSPLLGLPRGTTCASRTSSFNMASTIGAEDDWEEVAVTPQPTNKGCSSASTAAAAAPADVPPQQASQPPQDVHAVAAAKSSIPAVAPPAPVTKAPPTAQLAQSPKSSRYSRSSKSPPDCNGKNDLITIVCWCTISLLCIVFMWAIFTLATTSLPITTGQQHQALNDIAKLQQQLSAMQQQMQGFQDILHTVSAAQQQCCNNATSHQHHQHQQQQGQNQSTSWMHTSWLHRWRAAASGVGRPAGADGIPEAAGGGHAAAERKAASTATLLLML